jgi:hypothetical protein
MGLMTQKLFASEDCAAPARSSRRRHLLIGIALAFLACSAAAGRLIAKRERATRVAAPRARSVRKAAESEVASATLGITADAPGALIVVDGRAVGSAPGALDDLAPGRHRVRVVAADRIPWEREVNLLPGEKQMLRARLSMAPPRLRVESDVPGAIVFLDKRYLGKTPVAARAISRGLHRLDVSVEGYDVHSETIQADSGEHSVMVRFQEMHLNERVDVVHRHGIGSCRGTLIATLQGLRYESVEGEHSFAAPLDAIERFEVDYLKKNLSVRLRGGRKFNFTIRDGSADPLLIFHRKVERVRSALARKDTSS